MLVLLLLFLTWRLWRGSQRWGDSTGPRISIWQMRLLLFPVLWPRESNFTSLSLSFPIYTMGLALPPLEAKWWLIHPPLSMTMLLWSLFRLPDLSSAGLCSQNTLSLPHPFPLSHPWGQHWGCLLQETFGDPPIMDQGPLGSPRVLCILSPFTADMTPSWENWYCSKRSQICVFLHTRLGKKGYQKCVECNVFLPIHNFLLPSAPSFLLSLPETFRAQSHCSFSCFLWQTDPKLVLVVSASWRPYLCVALPFVWVGIVTCF